MSTDLIPVTTAPVFDPGAMRADHRMPAGLTLAEILRVALPGLNREHWGEVTIMLVTPEGVSVIGQPLWHCVRPNPGVHTVIRVRPSGPAVGAVLTSVLSVFAASAGEYLAGLLVTTAGTLQNVVAATIAAAITIAGSLLIQALIPQPQPEGSSRRNTYAISGWNNEIRPGDPVPAIKGKIRYAPPFAAPAYTEIVDGEQYVRALFTFGNGRLDISDLRIGDTPVTDFEGVEVEIREGVAGDAPVDLYPEQVLEDGEGVELDRPYPTDDLGNRLDDEGIETPVVRTTAEDTARVSAIFSFPQGLYHIDDEGGANTQTVTIRIRQRPPGGIWGTVAEIDFTARNRNAFYRQYTWSLPSRGKWEVEFTRLTLASNRFRPSRSFLAALQSIRPEYPVNSTRPLALVAMRVKATNQLSGSLDDVNAVVQRYGPVWDGEAWSTGLSRNPATAFLLQLQGDENPRPQADSQIDLDAIADWFEFCQAKGLKYDRAQDAPELLLEGLALIASAGRASPDHDGIRYGVVIDRPQELVVDHLSPRNSANFAWSRPYLEAPEGFRVSFRDETNGYNVAERVVPWPGYEGEPEFTEVLELVGKTDPDEIWIETRRRMYELIHRPDRYSAAQDFQVGVLTRGDKAMASRGFLAYACGAGRVQWATGATVTLDETVEIPEGETWALRFRTFASEEDGVGTSHLVAIAASDPPTRSLALASAEALPAVGSIVHFGPLATESIPVRVRSVERTEDGGRVLHMLDDAEIIDTLTDAEVPPEWTNRVGDAIVDTEAVPGVPYIAGVERVVFGLFSDVDPGLYVYLGAGVGDTATASIRVEHRKGGTSTWSSVTGSAAGGAVLLDEYDPDESVDLRLTAISYYGVESAPSAIVTIPAGFETLPAPGALDGASIVVIGSLGSAELAFATGSDTALDRVQVYRVPSGDTLNRNVHAAGAPIPVEPSTTVSYTDGDATRSNLLADAAFDDPGSWTADANWTVTGGVAAHAAGAADTIQQALSLTAGSTYRGRFLVDGRTAGDVTAELLGGTTQSEAAVDADGTAYLEIAAVSGNTSFGFTASSDFDGDIDDAVVFLETASCVPQGQYDYYLEPQNSIGAAGPISAASTVTIT